MNILFIISTLTGGGAEKVTSIVASELSKTNQVTLIVDERTEKEYDLLPSVNLISLNRKHSHNPFVTIPQKIKKFCLIRNIKKDYKKNLYILFLFSKECLHPADIGYNHMHLE